MPQDAVPATDRIAELLRQARAARGTPALAEGREFARQAWHEAAQAHRSSEQAEAGHLMCLFHYRLGDLPALIAAGETVLPLLQAPERRAAKSELLRWMSTGCCEIGRFDAALRHANDACAEAEIAGDPHQMALSLNALGGCFERIGDPWQAERLMGDALRMARGVADPFPQLVTLNNLCAVCIGAYYILRHADDRSDATAALRRALAHAREARALLPQFEDPFYSVFVEGNLGEVLLHLGRSDEARELLETALQRGLAHGYQAQVWRIRCSICELLLAQGQPEQARAALTTLLQDIAGRDPESTLIRVHHALYRACRDLGRIDEALHHLEQYERHERRRATQQLNAQSRLLVTRVEAEHSRRLAEHARLEAQTERTRAAGFEADAQRDELTGLGNRRHLEQRLPLLLDVAQEHDLPLTVALIDLDHFKQINDRFGHAVGDRVLEVVAQKLRENTRSSDVLARIGGEEFLVVFAEMTVAHALEVCERLRIRVAEHAWGDVAEGLSATLSIGLAQAPPYESGALFDQADRAMYRAKHSGRNRVSVAEE
jgi:diguanylate cyclase (GGDEF)-like protein